MIAGLSLPHFHSIHFSLTHTNAQQMLCNWTQMQSGVILIANSTSL